MKKFTVISLICIYALATMGFSLKEFYCCGKLKTVSLAIETAITEKCSKGDSKSDGCCQNKYQFFKVKDNHVASAHVVTPLKSFSDLHTFSPSYPSILFVTQHIDVINGSHAPPLYTGVPIYLSNCVFRI